MKFLIRIFFSFVIIFVSWFSYLYVYGNFHKVDNNLYRSAQLYSFNMPYYLKKYKIKSILNLRGKSNKSWYKTEIKISKKNNIIHYDYKIGDRGVISKEKMNNILNIIKNAPKPILIHCKAGADRTSLVSSIYRYNITHNYQKSIKEISMKYGHFPWLGSKTVAMDKSFEIFIKKNKGR